MSKYRSSIDHAFIRPVPTLRLDDQVINKEIVSRLLALGIAWGGEDAAMCHVVAYVCYSFGENNRRRARVPELSSLIAWQASETTRPPTFTDPNSALHLDIHRQTSRVEPFQLAPPPSNKAMPLPPPSFSLLLRRHNGRLPLPFLLRRRRTPALAPAAAAASLSSLATASGQALSSSSSSSSILLRTPRLFAAPAAAQLLLVRGVKTSSSKGGASGGGRGRKGTTAAAGAAASTKASRSSSTSSPPTFFKVCGGIGWT